MDGKRGSGVISQTSRKHMKLMGVRLVIPSSLIHITELPGRRALRSAKSNRFFLPPFKHSTAGVQRSVEPSQSLLLIFGTGYLTMLRRRQPNHSLSTYRKQLKLHDSVPAVISSHYSVTSITPIVFLTVVLLPRTF